MRYPRAVPPLFSVAVLAAAAACGSGGTRSSHYDPDVITAAEIEESSASNALQLVQQNRPAWLRGRGVESPSAGVLLPVVYVDRVQYGPTETLRDFPRGDLLELRYVDAGTATTRFGTGHGGGVIEVFLRR